MNKKRIKYVGFYDILNNKLNRLCDISAVNKMNYIAKSLVKSGYEVEIISPSWMKDDSNVSFESGYTQKIDENLYVTFCPSWRTNNKISRAIKILFSLLWLCYYLTINTTRNEKLLTYHVYWLSLPIRIAKFIRRFQLVLEVEEIYQDVMNVKKVFKEWEDKLIPVADAYLYSTDLLADKISSNKPYVVIYGEYKSVVKLSEPPRDGMIHLLYAGIVDIHKKGAFNALEASRYLPGNYILHIIGFGQVKLLEEKIKEYNKTNECKVTFDGLKTGDDYIKYCQTCHIGLSTQSMEGEYLQSSFPSKILSYLSLGLKVVSCEIECVTRSRIGEVINYYKEDKPEEIAKAIKKVNVQDEFDSSKIIKRLNEDFVSDIDSLFELNLNNR